MDPQLKIISPKPKKNNTTSRNLNIRSSYEHKPLKFEESVCDNQTPSSVKHINYFDYSLDKSKSTDNTTINPFKVLDIEQTGQKYDLFDEFEKELGLTSYQEELFSILNDNSSVKSSIFSQEDLNINTYYDSSYFNDDSRRKRISAPDCRPENPFFKNFESKEFVPYTKKSRSEEFC
jgi:hypothetical protein